MLNAMRTLRGMILPRGEAFRAARIGNNTEQNLKQIKRNSVQVSIKLCLNSLWLGHPFIQSMRNTLGFSDNAQELDKHSKSDQLISAHKSDAFSCDRYQIPSAMDSIAPDYQADAMRRMFLTVLALQRRDLNTCCFQQGIVNSLRLLLMLQHGWNVMLLLTET